MQWVRVSAVAPVLAALVSSLASGSSAWASAHHMFEDEAALAEGALFGDRTNAVPEPGSWNPANSPVKWDSQYVYALDQLPTEGSVAEHTPWSDTYWPTYKAGIAARWNWQGSNGFKYVLFDEASVRRMSVDELARLSPAEKYDIYMGRFDYPTVSGIRRRTSPSAERWAGICHGWAPAALNHAEPAAVTVTGPSGIAVPFGSADVKALLDQYYADNAVASRFLGTKCQAGSGGSIWRRIANPFLRGASCEDVNAGALHVILANELGRYHRGFVADIARWREVWNQPIYGFSSRVTGYRGPSRDSAPGTVREALVHTEMYYTDEIEPSWNPVVGTSELKTDVAKYDYAVELDASGRVIGGQWLSANRPDFLWYAAKLQFTGYFSGLNDIYRPSAL